MKKIIIILIALIILTFFLFANNPTKEVLKKNSKSIVQVINENNKNYIGSGVVIDKNLIITSAIILNKSLNNLYIITYDKKKFPVSLIGKDYESSLALLKIKNSSLLPIRISNKIEIGDWVALIGSFYSNFPSIYNGIVSSKSNDTLIINAPVVPGASGGAVVDKTGALVGIIRGSYGFSTTPDYVFKTYKDNLVIKSENFKSNKLCYAVPVNEVLNITKQLKKFGRVRRSFLGVYAKEYKGNIIIENIVKGSSAEKYGLKKGDIILMIGKDKIDTYPKLIKNIKKINPGEKFNIKIKRDGKIKKLSIIMGERKYKNIYGFDLKSKKFKEIELFKEKPLPDLPEISEIPEIPKVKKIIIKSFGSRILGIEVYELTPELAQVYKIREGKGLLISKVGKKTAAYKGGLKVGDIIVRINGKTVGSVEKTRDILNSLKDNEKAKIELYRGRKLLKFSILPDKSKYYSFDNLNKNIKEIKIKLRKLKENEKIKYHIENLRKQIMKLRKELKDNYPKIKKSMKDELNRLKEEINRLKFEITEKNG
jgi:serine protease Do